MAAIKYPNGSGGWNTIYNLSGMKSHVHGNITNDGKVGTTEGKVLMTSTGGTVIATDMPSTSAPLDSYPVGAIYMSYASTSPATLFGGTWAAIDAGRFLVAAGSGYAAGATGGTTTHTHTTPNHSHSVNTHSHGLGAGQANISSSGSTMIFHYKRSSFQRSYTLPGSAAGYASSGASSDSVTLGGTTDGATSATDSSGAGTSGSGSNLPPYYAVYMWRRTA